MFVFGIAICPCVRLRSRDGIRQRKEGLIIENAELSAMKIKWNKNKSRGLRRMGAARMGGTPIPDSIKSFMKVIAERVTMVAGRERFYLPLSLIRRRLLNLIKTVCRPNRVWPDTKVNSLSLTENTICTYT